MLDTIANMLDVHIADENPHQRLDAVRYRIKAGSLGIFSEDWAIYSTERNMSLEQARRHLASMAEMFKIETKDMGTWFAGRFADGGSEGKWFWDAVCAGRRIHMDYMYEGGDFEKLERLNPGLPEDEIRRLLGWD